MGIASLKDEPPLKVPPDRVGLVAVDVDGTLLRSDRKICVAAVEAIRRCVRHKVKVVLASARPPRSVRRIHQALGLDTVSIHYNGALIHDLIRGKHLFHQPLDPKLAGKIIQFARGIDPKLIVSLEILDKWYTDHFDPQYATETGRIFKPDEVGPLDTFLAQPVTKLMLLGPPARLAKVRLQVIEQFGGQIGVAVTDPDLIQITHQEVDKAAALARVARVYGVKRRNIMAIGDAPNDAPMLQWSGWGVAVGNAWPEAREAADAVAPSNNDRGVAYAIRRYVFGEKR